METYPLDIPAEQIVRWLIEEERAGRHDIRITATRSYLREDVPTLEQLTLSEEEREDLTEVTEIGVLEVAPQHGAEGWVLRVRIEDALGERLPEDAPAPDEPEELDLNNFQKEFVLPGRGTAFVAVDAETPDAWASFQWLLREMQTDKHLK